MSTTSQKTRRFRGGLAGALSRGEAAKVEWVRTGELVTAKAVAQAWGLRPQALGWAARRGEVFAVTVNRQRYYPCEFIRLSRVEVGALCVALEGLTPVEMFLFFKRKHGALKGKTVVEALGESDLVSVVAYARSQTEQLRRDTAAGVLPKR